jgi:hypothetical protein
MPFGVFQRKVKVAAQADAARMHLFPGQRCTIMMNTPRYPVTSTGRLGGNSHDRSAGVHRAVLPRVSLIYPSRQRGVPLLPAMKANFPHSWP